MLPMESISTLMTLISTGYVMEKNVTTADITNNNATSADDDDDVVTTNEYDIMACNDGMTDDDGPSIKMLMINKTVTHTMRILLTKVTLWLMLPMMK